jgi:hypothetical protein
MGTRFIAEEPQGYSTDHVKKTTIIGYLTVDELNLIRGILTFEQNELDKDEMAEVIHLAVGSVTEEAAMILVSRWYDAGRNKQEWEEKELNYWIQNTLSTKIGSDREKVAERRADVSGSPLRPVLHYALASKRKGYGGKYMADGTLHAPIFTTDMDEVMEYTGSELMRMAYDWTLDWNAVILG